MFVGGEFYADDTWLRDAPTLSIDGALFLSGGQACLKVIGSALLAQGVQSVLLPDYLCPSIVTVLEGVGLTCDFYRVDPALAIDRVDVESRLDTGVAFYFIHYFGFPPDGASLDWIRSLQRAGTLVVEDQAQAAFRPPACGDFAFNSLRKFGPFDGGYLTTRFDLQPVLRSLGDHESPRMALIRAYRSQLAAYLRDGEGDFDRLVDLFARAERAYELDGALRGDEQERRLIECQDWVGIREKRRENYAYLLSLLPMVPAVQPIFSELPADVMPMGMPVTLTGVDRDTVNEALGKARIGLSIHWDELAHHPRTRENHAALALVGRMLTLPVDQRTSHKQLDYLVVNLARAVAAAGG